MKGGNAARKPKFLELAPVSASLTKADAGKLCMGFT